MKHCSTGENSGRVPLSFKSLSELKCSCTNSNTFEKQKNEEDSENIIASEVQLPDYEGGAKVSSSTPLAFTKNSLFEKQGSVRYLNDKLQEGVAYIKTFVRKSAG